MCCVFAHHCLSFFSYLKLAARLCCAVCRTYTCGESRHNDFSDKEARLQITSLKLSLSLRFPYRAVMPGMVMFRRRWSVGSDDLVLPALFLFLLHCIWWVGISFVVFNFPVCISFWIFLAHLWLSSLGWSSCPWFFSASRTVQTSPALKRWWTMAEGTWASWSAALSVRVPSCGWAWEAAFCTHSPEKLCSTSSI